MKKRILLCTQWMDRYRPLVRALLSTGNYTLYCEENFVKKYGEYQPDLHSYQALLPPPDRQRLELEVKAALASMLPCLASEAERSISDYSRFCCLSDVDLMSQQLRDSLMQTLYMIDAFDRMMLTTPMDLLITDGPGIRQQAWVAAAKKHKVPSLEIYHGMIHVKPELVPGRVDQADYMAMGSALVKDVYVQLGLPPDRLRVTGLPAEPVANFSQAEAVRILTEKYGLDPQKKIALLYLSYDSGDTFEFLFDLTTGYQVQLLRQTLEAIKKFNLQNTAGLQLVVKRHPTIAASGWDDEQAYHYYADQVGQKLFAVHPSESNPLLLAAADVVLVVKFSSTISEALNADRPVIIWPYSRDWLHDDLLNSGALVPVEDQNSLEKSLHSCLLDEKFFQLLSAKRQAFLQKYPHVNTTEANTNIVRYVADIIENHAVQRPRKSIRIEQTRSSEVLLLESVL